MIPIKLCMKYVGRLGMMKYFRADPIAQGEMARWLQKMVEREDQLEWLVATLIDHVGEWPGPKEVRGLLCSRFKPADGIEENTSIAGFTPADCEARNLEKSERYKQLDAGTLRAGGMKRIG